MQVPLNEAIRLVVVVLALLIAAMLGENDD